MTNRPASSRSPVPSITLQITSKDAERFLEASKALQLQCDAIANKSSFKENHSPSDNDKHSNDVRAIPLHEMLHNAAKECDHPFIVQFLDRMHSFLEPALHDTDQALLEVKASLLLFHDCDKTTKLRHLFSILSSSQLISASERSTPKEDEKKDDNMKPVLSTHHSVVLTEANAISLFRTILVAISSCIHKPKRPNKLYDNKLEGSHVSEDGNPSVGSKNPSNSTILLSETSINSEQCIEKNGTEQTSDDYQPPTKKQKIVKPEIIGSSQNEILLDEFVDASQSLSWDSSLAPLRDEDDKLIPFSNGKSNSEEGGSHIFHEIRAIALYATEELFRFASRHAKNERQVQSHDQLPMLIDFVTFSEWYNSCGFNIVPWLELLQHSKWKPAIQKKENNLPVSHTSSQNSTKVTVRDRSHQVPHSDQKSSTESIQSSNSPFATSLHSSSRTLVSFDFNGSGSPTPLLINISEDNLTALHALVNQTNLNSCTASHACKALLLVGTDRSVDGKECLTLTMERFREALSHVIPRHVYNELSQQEKECIDDSFADFFSCFEDGNNYLLPGEVDLKEFTVGFSFFCAGNKSSKLLTGFELLDYKRRGYLTEEQLSRYLQSYLTMLVALSLLMPMSKQQQRRRLTPRQKKDFRLAVESGTRWTLGHFLKASGQSKNEYTFECFANWYSTGGYNIAPWLELLDLKKVMALIAEPESHLHLPPLSGTKSDSRKCSNPRTTTRDRVSSLRRHHSSRRGPSPEVLFTFPLGNRRSLVVLKEDAAYVRGVVDQLGILTITPDALWSALFKAVEKRRRPDPDEVAVYVDMATFVQCMKEVCPKPSRKRPAPGIFRVSGSVDEILANFYQCFDIEQSDSVALDELMGGLTLLCGGKKSTKLAFAFSIFDTRPGINVPGKNDRVIHSLSGEDLFLFLRSVLIVTFSTCRQSLDMTDEIVGRYIADTANMICNDVMRHQWETKQLDRLDFDEFGQWYNAGGYNRAPWLELLDLNKWVLLDGFSCMDIGSPTNSTDVGDIPACQSIDPPSFSHPSPRVRSASPPPLPEEALDNGFLDDMDSMDEMDMLLMQTSCDRDEHKISKSFSYSYSPNGQCPSTSSRTTGNPLKFHLVTTEEHGGYMLSLSPVRIAHFRRLLELSGLHTLDTESACNRILHKGANTKLTKKAFDSAIRDLMSTSSTGCVLDDYTSNTLKGVFNSVFEAFDHDQSGQVSAIEVACGITVLCKGKKSDKLEFAFEVLDRKKRGRLSQTDMSNYLRSFLSVLLSIAFSPSLDFDPSDDTLCTMSGSHRERSTSMLIRVVRAGADWAASLAFRDFDPNYDDHRVSMSFDDFASWYTRAGYSSIPWLELLDLQKWAMVQESQV